jgi:hypothetical protein
MDCFVASLLAVKMSGSRPTYRLRNDEQGFTAGAASAAPGGCLTGATRCQLLPDLKWNSAPSLMPEGQRAVTVLSRV